MGQVSTEQEVASGGIVSIRESFGWAYGGGWRVDHDEKVIAFVADSGSVAEEFRRANQGGRFREGEGLLGRTWQTREMVVMTVLPESNENARVAAARKAGLKSAVCLPILVDGAVEGASTLSAKRSLSFPRIGWRLSRSAGRMISTRLERVRRQSEVEQAKKDMERKVNQLMKVAQAAAKAT